MKVSLLVSSLVLISSVYARADYKHVEIEKDTVLLVNTVTEKLIFNVEDMEYSVAKLEVQKEDNRTLEQASWLKTIGSSGYELGKGATNVAWSATKLGARATWNVTSAFAEWSIRTAIAYNVAYYNVEAVEWGITKGAGILTSLALGPAAGAGAEAAIGTGLKVGRFVMPGFEALISSAATPVVKPATDFIINNTPAALKATGQAAQSIWSFGQNAASYFWGKTQTT